MEELRRRRGQGWVRDRKGRVAHLLRDKAIQRADFRENTHLRRQTDSQA